MATKLSDILKQESSGIMFPFKNNVKPVKTEQQVYTPTDGIMNIKGTAYEGPDATIMYGPESLGYPRQLKEIEKGLLPQFDQSQFPDKGTGKIETPPSSEITLPFEGTPDKPLMDPCPAGYRFDEKLQRCVLIEEPKDKSDTRVKPVNPPRNIGSTAKALDNIAQAAIDQNLHTKYGEDITIKIDNSSVLSQLGFVGKLVDGIFVKGPADNRLKEFGTYTDLSTDGINITANKDGTFDVKMNQQGKYNFGKIQTDQSLRGNLASTQKTDKQGNIIMAPNNTPMIVGPISVNTFGATTPTKLTSDQISKNKAAAEKIKAEADKAKKSIPSSAPKSKGGQGMLGFERGVKGTFAQAPSEVREVKKSATQIENELDDLLKSKITESDRQAAKGTTGSSANKGKQGKIVCTMMNESYGFGSFRNKIWLSYAKKLTKEHEVGYHTLFLPLVKYAKQKGFTNNIVKKVLEHIAIHRTIDIRKQKYNKVDVLGRIYRTILEPLCYITGGVKTWKKK